jgi:hypothetical protein
LGCSNFNVLSQKDLDGAGISDTREALYGPGQAGQKMQGLVLAGVRERKLM